MKFTQKQILIGIIATVLLASGCASQTQGQNSGDSGSATAPMQIQEFSAFPDPAPSDNQVTFRMELKNTGGADAEDVIAKLTNPPWAEDSSDTRTWRGDEGGGVRNDVGNRSFYFDTMEGQSDDVERFSRTETLSLTSPDLNEDQSFPYNFIAELSYKYKTTGSTSISVMDEETFRENNGERSNTVTIDHNDAPIHLEGQLQDGNPVVFYDSDEGSKTVDFCVVVSNEGEGTVFSRSAHQDSRYVVDDQNKNKVQLRIESLGSTTIDGSDSVDVETELVGGDKKRECFEMEIDGLANSGSQKEIGPINIEASYGYQKSQSRTVTVEGR